MSFQNLICLLIHVQKVLIKFIYSEKATKFREISTFFLTGTSNLLVINVGSDTFGNPIFQKGLQN